MEKTKINMLMLIFKQKIPENKITKLKTLLENTSDEVLENLQFIKFYHPIFILIMSICFGTLGVDRFVLGDIFLGIVKILLWVLILLTPIFYLPYILILEGIWLIIDTFLCYNKAKTLNYNSILKNIPNLNTSKYKAEELL